MLLFLPEFLRIALSLLLFSSNTLLHCVPLFLLAFVKALLPIPPLRRALSRVLVLIAESWIAVNGLIFRLFTRIDWQIEGCETIRYEGHYLVLSNHQTWVDIPVLQRIFNKKIPFLKFFLKQELIWVPILGIAWWALDFPFMKRYSKEFLEQHPDMRGKDLETTRRACEKFRDLSVSVMNFAEGTRFTPQKHAQQQSPYQHLLKPKTGGVAFVFNAMGDVLQSVIDVTLIYPQRKPSFIDLMAGRLKKIKIVIRELEIPPSLLGGDYENDADYRQRCQQWLADLWAEKDALIAQELKKANDSQRIRS